MCAVIGRRYRVIDDENGFFEPGEIVIALEDNDTPYCVRESEYVEGKEIFDYEPEKLGAMIYDEDEDADDNELEEVEN